MKNAKTLFLSVAMLFTGSLLANGCANCPSCPGQAMVCTAEGCSIPGVEAEPTRAKKTTKVKKETTETQVSEEAATVAPEAESEMPAADMPKSQDMPEAAPAMESEVDVHNVDIEQDVDLEDKE